jgi:hypothetical protein
MPFERKTKTWTNFGTVNPQAEKQPTITSLKVDLGSVKLSEDDLNRVRNAAVQAALTEVKRMAPEFMDSFSTFSTFSTFGTFGMIMAAGPRPKTEVIDQVVNTQPSYYG